MEINDHLRSITAVAQVGGFLQYYQRSPQTAGHHGDGRRVAVNIEVTMLFLNPTQKILEGDLLT